MKKLILAASVLSVGLCAPAFAESTYMPSYVEKGLIKVCISAAQDKTHKMAKSIKEMHLKHKFIALNVMCNGQNIIAFAERYGAERTSSRLSNSVGSVQVTDIVANNHNYDVTFEFKAN